MELLGYLRRALVAAAPLLLPAAAHATHAAAPIDSIAGWRVVGVPGSAQPALDSTQKHGGATSAHLRFTPQDMQLPPNVPDQMKERVLLRGAGFSQSLDATPYRGRRLKLTVWVRATLPDKPAPKVPASKVQVFMSVLNADTTQVTYDGSISPLLASCDWTKKVVVLEVPPDGVIISLGVQGIGQGEVWVDDVTLEDQAEAMGPYDKKPIVGPGGTRPPIPALSSTVKRPTEIVNGDFEGR